MDIPFYSKKELNAFGFKAIGNAVHINKTVQIYKPEVISFGSNVLIDDFCVLSGGIGIELGDYTQIGSHSALYGSYGIKMEDFTTLANRVAIYTESDDYTGLSLTNYLIPRSFKPKYEMGAVVIKKHAIVGTNSTILPNVTLEDGSAVGAHSLVKTSCQPWSIYAGSPARRIKDRNKDVCRLEEEFLKQFSRVK